MAKKPINWHTLTLNPLEMEELLIWYYWTSDGVDVPIWVTKHPLWPQNSTKTIPSSFGVTKVFNDQMLKTRIRMQMKKMEGILNVT